LNDSSWINCSYEIQNVSCFSKVDLYRRR
jgi:hypothetical protein